MSSMRMDKNWPKLEDTRLLGKRVSRLDGPDKVTGRAKYTYDQNPKDLLYAKFAWCPYGHAKIKSIDVSKAAKMPGVVRAFELVKPGDEISYAGVEVAVVAADTGAFVGEVGFADYRRDLQPSIHGTPEIGWALMPAAQGRGIATEAVRAAVAWGDGAFADPRTVCIIDPGNLPSLRVAEKLGYRAILQTVYKGDPTLLLERLRG